MLVSGSVVQDCWSPVTPEVEIVVSGDNLLVFQTVFGSKSESTWSQEITKKCTVQLTQKKGQDMDHPFVIYFVNYNNIPAEY